MPRRRLSVLGGIALLLLLNLALAAHAAPSSNVEGPVIHLEDVDRFYKLYDGAGGHPSAEQLQREYLDLGSEGLHTFAKIRNITGERIAATLAKTPELYSTARQCAAALPHVRHRLSAAMGKLAELYPDARFPPITIAVGRGRPVGTASQRDGVMIGLEALCAVKYFDPNVEDRFVHVIAHEYIHVQEKSSITDDEHPTVLELSLAEGAAEFVGEMISGGVANPGIWAEAKGRETQIETAFVPDEDKTDLSDWAFNGSLEKPGDLAYWVGYRIVKSYYQHASDKRRAIREILEMSDPKDFLAKSAWRPGMQLH